MTIAEVEEALHRDLQILGIPVRIRKESKPITQDVIFIHVKRREGGTYWRSGFVEVNFCSPDISGEPAKIRLKELERIGSDFFRQETVGEYNGSYYQYSSFSQDIIKDETLKCHYVNFRILLKDLNVI